MLLAPGRYPENCSATQRRLSRVVQGGALRRFWCSLSPSGAGAPAEIDTRRLHEMGWAS